MKGDGTIDGNQPEPAAGTSRMDETNRKSQAAPTVTLQAEV
jgi:hypothetical protein